LESNNPSLQRTQGDSIRAELDTDWYEPGVTISDAEMDALPLTRHDWHGDWNYTLHAAPNA
jgi:alpha-ketoglutarate-dependent taurine dioxygenase